MARNTVRAWAFGAIVLAASYAKADFSFSTDDPDGRMGMASRPESPGIASIEAADDFILSSLTTIDHAQFTGLIPDGAFVNQVVVEIYRIFPQDSSVPPGGNVPSRINSPSDTAFASRDSALSNLEFGMTNLGAFTVANSVLNGINPIPGQTTGGEGTQTGNEVQMDVTFSTPFVLPADHYFFVPQVQLSNGDFFWLSSSHPISSSGTPIVPDLQTWIRNANLSPDWLRVGTDIVGGSATPAFNGSFALFGRVSPVPEPGSLTLALIGLVSFAGAAWSKRRSAG